jgi:drug/metabolite transporter (DMT)-like permease
MGSPDTFKSGVVAGILWMALAGLCSVVMGTIIKHLGNEVPAAQSAFLRFALGLPIILPFIWKSLPVRFSPGQLRLLWIRGGVHAAGMTAWYFSLTHIPFADVSALGYLTPVLVSIGATVFLGERLGRFRVLAVMVALIGALIILRPGFQVVETGHLAMIVMTVFLATSYLIAKFLLGQLHPVVVVGMLMFTVTLVLAPFALWVWVPIAPQQYLLLFVAAIFATAGQYAVTRALQAAPVSVTQPASFLQLIWAAVLGAVIFGEVADVWVLLGGAVIVASVCLVTIYESRDVRRTDHAVQPHPENTGSRSGQLRADATRSGIK